MLMVKWWSGFWLWVFNKIACSVEHDWLYTARTNSKRRRCIRCGRIENKYRKRAGQLPTWEKEKL